MNRRTVVLASAVVVVSAELIGIGQPWQTAAVFAFVALVPGLALLRTLEGTDRLTRVVVTVAASLALAAALSETFAIVHHWTAIAVMVTLAAISVLACVRLGAGR